MILTLIKRFSIFFVLVLFQTRFLYLMSPRAVLDEVYVDVDFSLNIVSHGIMGMELEYNFLFDSQKAEGFVKTFVTDEDRTLWYIYADLGDTVYNKLDIDEIELDIEEARVMALPLMWGPWYRQTSFEDNYTGCDLTIILKEDNDRNEVDIRGQCYGDSDAPEFDEREVDEDIDVRIL